jgi:hypothetical protein
MAAILGASSSRYIDLSQVSIRDSRRTGKISHCSRQLAEAEYGLDKMIEKYLEVLLGKNTLNVLLAMPR